MQVNYKTRFGVMYISNLLIDSNAILEHLTMHLQITVFTTHVSNSSSVNHESLGWTSCINTNCSLHAYSEMNGA